MDFLKSYAHQVVSYHPDSARDDLFTELHNELCEEFADWNEEHPDGDEAAFLNAKKDHPMRFATQLAPEGSAYLIGPQFYYSFISAMKIATVVTFVFHLFLGVISALGSGAYLASITRVLFSVPGTLLWVYASIIGVFIALERSGEKATWLDNWNASKLVSSDSHQTISKSETFFDMGISLLGLLWLLDIVQFPSLVFHDGIWISGWIANLPKAFWVMAGVLFVVDIGFCFYKLVRNFWSPNLRFMAIGLNIVWMAVLSFAAARTQLISLDDVTATGMQDLQTLINNVAHGVLLVVIAVLLIDSLKHCWKLFKPGYKSKGSKEAANGY
ncbi:MAG: hypothetical protein ACR2QG_02630 [Gammaproteobacteria bacterium]